jgi:hypothetical protein
MSSWLRGHLQIAKKKQIKMSKHEVPIRGGCFISDRHRQTNTTAPELGGVGGNLGGRISMPRGSRIGGMCLLGSRRE